MRRNKADELWIEMGYDIKYIMLDACVSRRMLFPSTQMLGSPRKYHIDYMNELRQFVGKRPLIMVGAALLVLNQGNQLLMMKRTDNKCWGIPGGAMELGEDLEGTVKRETREEIGIDLNELELFGVYSGKDMYYKYPNGVEVFNVSVVYLTRNIRELIEVNLREHSEYRYFDIHNLPAEISPPIKSILKDLVNKYNLKGKI